MLIDLDYEFEGFWGTQGRCHIRLRKAAPDKPLTIVCSQYLDYYGTSVTNAFERIATSLLYRIARGGIDGVQFDFELPLYTEWDTNTNWFDRLLVKCFPQKYFDKFTSQKLKIKETFDRLIWIEHYPPGGSLIEGASMYQVVKFDENEKADFCGRPSEDCLRETTGYAPSELFPQAAELDLKIIGAEPRYLRNPVTLLNQINGTQIVRWTENLVPHIAASSESFQMICKPATDDILEKNFHAIIANFLSYNLPMRNLFEMDFNIPLRVGLRNKTRPKNVDFAIFKPNKEIDSIIEVKRTSSKTKILKREVCKDIARLMLISNSLKCTCYLLVCGDTQSIQSQLVGCDEYLSLFDNDIHRDRFFSISKLQLDDEYSGYLNGAFIRDAASRLQGAKTSGCHSAFLWQIDADIYSLTFNRPYQFYIATI